jgi:hypothetical protein
MTSRAIGTVGRDALDVSKVVALPVKRDHSNCPLRRYCPTCEQWTEPSLVNGRWDPIRNATAIPFDPVWVRLFCGCTFGDESLAHAAEAGPR